MILYYTAVYSYLHIYSQFFKWWMIYSVLFVFVHCNNNIHYCHISLFAPEGSKFFLPRELNQTENFLLLDSQLHIFRIVEKFLFLFFWKGSVSVIHAVYVLRFPKFLVFEGPIIVEHKCPQRAWSLPWCAVSSGRHCRLPK